MPTIDKTRIMAWFGFHDEGEPPSPRRSPKGRFVSYLLVIALLAGASSRNLSSDADCLIEEPKPKKLVEEPPPITQEQAIARFLRESPLLKAEPPSLENLQNAIQTKQTKPKLVLHVGPMKTGTSSLQADLDWLMGDYLEKDNWFYIRSDHPMEFIPQDDPETFAQQFKSEADQLLSLRKNIIRSREQYSAFFSDHPVLYERLGELLRPDWDLTIVAGYRPYHEWLVSFWYQCMRMEYSDPNLPEERSQNVWRMHDTSIRSGRLYWVEPILPNFHQFWKDKPRYTDSIVEYAAAAQLPVQIFDIHDPKGSRSAFLCDIVEAPHACRHSLQIDMDNPPKRVNRSNLKEVQYDAIALGAVAQGMVDEHKFRRDEIIDALVERQEVELNLTVMDFPLLCPEQSVLEELRNYTLTMDRVCMADRYQDSADRAAQLLSNFDRAVEKKKYCRVDVDTILRQRDWIFWFQKYSP